ncbi:MAG: 50S ribosomal protein L17 [Candidatus Saccharibacteria bacterium]|nr:50S ribosomal protein L17 [Candidatus Saccharibacteria bacterium]
MHRHGYKGRKFGRERDQRRALMRGLSMALVEHGAIVTTLPKAKDLRPMVEKMVTKARKGGLSNRRALIAAMNVDSANRLMDVIVPSLKRESGYLRIVKLDQNRVGDNAEMARIEFVDEIAEIEKPAKEAKATKKGDK